jgi:hypothetical protein
MDDARQRCVRDDRRGFEQHGHCGDELDPELLPPVLSGFVYYRGRRHVEPDGLCPLPGNARPDHHVYDLNLLYHQRGGSGFYVTVLSDAGQPIQGAQVSGTRVTDLGTATCQQDIGTYVTNSTGSVLITPNIGSYYLLSIVYQGNTYAAKAPIAPMTTTYVTLKVPSGNVTISEVFEGGCQTNAQGVTCPG